MRILLFLMAAGALTAGGPGLVLSHYSPAGMALTADPESPAWKRTNGVFADKGPMGEAVPHHRTEIRSRWTKKDLYVLFVCPYQELFLKPNPSRTAETNHLWDWDVAEVFVGADFQRIHRYKEFQVSPQGEWVDLEIDRRNPLPEGGWRWNSGFAVRARLGRPHRVWYGEMRIPFAKIDARTPRAGNELRINFYRIQGPGPRRTGIAWQPTGQPSYHVPEAFGRIRLVE